MDTHDPTAPAPCQGVSLVSSGLFPSNLLYTEYKGTTKGSLHRLLDCHGLG